MECELLSVLECLKEFRSILLGQQIKVYTDHKNLVYDASGMTSQQVLRWCLLLKEFSPDICYIKGEHNRVTDALSRLSINGQCLSTDETQEYFGPTQSGENLFPLSTATIAQYQHEDKKLMSRLSADLDKKNPKFNENNKWDQQNYRKWTDFSTCSPMAAVMD